MAAELLNPRDHGALRLRPHEETPHFVQIVPAEFAAAAACCPILFSKEEATGAFFIGAMFGFRPGENLLDAGDRAGFVPLFLQREGFFISGREIAIDRSHPRFSDSEGEPLFDDSHHPGRRLRAIQQALGQIHAGMEQARSFVAAMGQHRLIEPVDISLAFDDGERLTLRGLYTVSLDRLKEIDDATALALFRAGHLQLAYLMAASFKQIGRLAQSRNRRG